ncbi:FHA domain-containing protein [Candidatus Thiothrix sp. Deng01]|uniref:FHA domain-containing protein n=1 Tax=Candidatus Thiothrix phosphatis TaxID=3112415 RepID=A0ABU6CXL4_9GAMM|nr:FHA domain-containing protein [Candidatus Thiothrix sp. Deng01]MEB4591287.1 FHA domain-containing protein [Candidatus Thiothrix sp. Deng01]
MQEEDRTIIMFPPGDGGEPPDDKTRFVRPGLRVTLLKAGEQAGESRFFPEGFRAGRAQDNDLVIPFNIVSRHHLEVKRQADGWWLHDNGSANGVYLDGRRIAQPTRLALPALLQLGDSACFLQLEETSPLTPPTPTPLPEPDAPATGTQTAATATSTRSSGAGRTGELTREQLKQRLLAETAAEDAGDYTRMVRALIHEDRSARRQRYRGVLWGAAALLLAAAALLAYQQLALERARTLAIDMFYDIKTLELNLSQAEIRLEEHMATLQAAIEETRNEKLIAEQKKLEEERFRLVRERERLGSMRVKYQQYVQEANALKLRFPGASAYEEQLILKVARQFGESELEAPPEFVNEVRRYIGYWQGSSRFPAAMQRLEANGYAPVILSALQQQNLPPDFIYLPLQESNYNTQAIGPETRYGIAKGAWQFLASTGQEYGLQAGPKAGVREYDPLDQRFDFNRASAAGARYLKYIYSTEAQASGLLVMASYNYGHNRVRGLIKKMPENPRDRNFWKFIQHYQIPQETYDYVFYIVAAAVIGEDPAHFGFRFKPPLANSGKPAGAGVS